MNTRAGHWADQKIPHRDWPEAGDDTRVSKAEQEDRMPEVDNPTLPQFVVVIALYIGAVVGIVAAAKYFITGVL